MSKKATVAISKLCIEIGGKKIELTMKQAKELSEVLNDTFGTPETIFRDRWHYVQPSPPAVPYSPFFPNWYCTTSGEGTGTCFTSDVLNTDTAIITGTEWQGTVASGLITLTAQ